MKQMKAQLREVQSKKTALENQFNELNKESKKVTQSTMERVTSVLGGSS